MKLQLRKYSTRSSRMALHSMQQELGFQQHRVSHTCVSSVVLLGLRAYLRYQLKRVSQTRGVFSPTASIENKGVHLPEWNQADNVHFAQDQNWAISGIHFRCGFCSSSSLWWFAWVEPRSCPSQLASMHPRVSVLNLKSRVAPKILAQQLSNTKFNTTTGVSRF